MATLTDTIQELRSVPRAARVAQGYTRIADFARHVMRVRAARAERRQTTDSLVLLRREITGRLQRILDADRALRRAARSAAGLPSRDSAPCTVAYAPRRKGEPLHASRTQPAERGKSYVKYTYTRPSGYSYTHYEPSTRHVSVPAAWLVARIREAAHV